MVVRSEGSGLARNALAMRGESIGDDQDRAVGVELVALVEQRDRCALEPVLVEQCQIDVGDDDGPRP